MLSCVLSQSAWATFAMVINNLKLFVACYIYFTCRHTADPLRVGWGLCSGALLRDSGWQTLHRIGLPWQGEESTVQGCPKPSQHNTHLTSLHTSKWLRTQPLPAPTQAGIQSQHRPGGDLDDWGTSLLTSVRSVVGLCSRSWCSMSSCGAGISSTRLNLPPSPTSIWHVKST